jgi:ATP-binding cassette subfamily B protein
LSGANRIQELLDDDTTVSTNPHGHNAAMRGDVALEGVTFGYGGTPVLEDLSFRVSAGETVALVGSTGSGKSSLTKLLNRSYDPDSGRILVDTVDLRDWDLGVLRSQISMIEQDVILFSRSIAENIAFGVGAGADRRQIEQVAQAAQAHAFIMQFAQGYETIISERGTTLSGGQRQRLAIARALLTDSRILILDDATSAVDSATEEEIRQAIRRVSAGRTTFLITHRPAQIKHADRVLVLDKGRLADQGTHDELMERCALYRRIFAVYA